MDVNVSMIDLGDGVRIQCSLIHESSSPKKTEGQLLQSRETLFSLNAQLQTHTRISLPLIIGLNK